MHMFLTTVIGSKMVCWWEKRLKFDVMFSDEYQIYKAGALKIETQMFPFCYPDDVPVIDQVSYILQKYVSFWTANWKSHKI